MANLCPGFIGMASVDDQLVRCSDFSVNPSQSFLFYDHVIGLNDTVPINNNTKGEEVGTIQIQKRIGRPSPISIGGGFSFPAMSSGISVNSNFIDLFNHAKYGTYFNIKFQYHRGTGQRGRSFTGCRVNQFNFSVTASDILNISVDIFALDMEESGNVDGLIEPAKLITWDKIGVNVGGISETDGIQGFEFSINNNLQNVYTVLPDQSNSFLPKDIRIGMQEVTGSVSLYNIPGQSFITASTGSVDIDLTAPGWSEKLIAILKPQEVGAVLGPVISNIPFVGVDKAFGD